MPLSLAVGLPELVARSVEEYINSGVRLSQEPQELSRLRAHLAGPGRERPLFDTLRTTRALEAAYLAIADQHRRDVQAPIDVR